MHPNVNKFILYTNNPMAEEYFKNNKAKDKLPIDPEIHWINGTALEVITAVKTTISHGAVLLSDPMAAIKPQLSLFPGTRSGSSVRDINPFKSLLTHATEGSKGFLLDFSSMTTIAEAIKIYKNNARLRYMSLDDNTSRNFQLLDFEALLKIVADLE